MLQLHLAAYSPKRTRSLDRCKRAAPTGRGGKCEFAAPQRGLSTLAKADLGNDEPREVLFGTVLQESAHILRFDMADY